MHRSVQNQEISYNVFMLKNRQTLLFVGDVVMLGLALWTMTALRFDFSTQNTFVQAQARTFALLFIAWLIVFFIFDLYNLRRVNPNPRNIGTLGLAIATSTAISVILFYIFPVQGITPKTNLIIIAVISFVLLVTWRRIFYKLFASTYLQKIALIGNDPAIEHLRADLAKHPHIGTVVVNIDKYDPAQPLPSLHLIITDDINLRDLIHIQETTKAEVLSLASAYEELFGKIPLALMNDERAVSILTRRLPIAYRLIERLLEIIIATLLLLITSPILLITTIARLVEDGRPIIIGQSRVGKGGAIFRLYKFRSMKALAPDGSAEIGAAQWAEKRDPRITPLGRILRKTHIDEIPQMWNILRGDLALIGPRAERPEFVATLEKNIPYYYLRHIQKPGFTGWAQIKFRYARTVLEAQEKFEYDLYYLQHKNPLLDVGIVLKTAQIIFTH
jgi:lipopolysaccharide/colanic/teichoic acid biosynthesis glycosyltransferase